MASVSTYLNFSGNAEEAFDFYKSIFGTRFQGDIMRWKDMPPQEDFPAVPEVEKNKVMHMALPIIGGHLLMGGDQLDILGSPLIKGNNVEINLQVDTQDETKRLFSRLSEGGEVTMELADTFWGDYFGSCVDKFGICWMVNCPEKA